MTASGVKRTFLPVGVHDCHRVMIRSQLCRERHIRSEPNIWVRRHGHEIGPGWAFQHDITMLEYARPITKMGIDLKLPA
jgi:hypothetical protein